MHLSLFEEFYRAMLPKGASGLLRAKPIAVSVSSYGDIVVADTGSFVVSLEL
jgi:hypothetical protein